MNGIEHKASRSSIWVIPKIHAKVFRAFRQDLWAALLLTASILVGLLFSPHTISGSFLIYFNKRICKWTLNAEYWLCWGVWWQIKTFGTIKKRRMLELIKKKANFFSDEVSKSRVLSSLQLIEGDGRSLKENGVENATAGKKRKFFLQVRFIKYSQTFNAF